MPTLNWIGKEAVVEHHKRVPLRLLECDRELSAGDPDAGNLLVQGDNLEALNALLPRYKGQVKCIYIDPPYNTGNEGWIYNDNVNDPRIKKWLGEVVRKEAEDLCRHDKWLCMMYPRLALLREFLRRDGVILISIDDFESFHLRCLMDEIFGAGNFVAQLVWDKTRKNDAKLFSVGHEYLLVYANSLSHLRAVKTVWREQKPGAREIIDHWRHLKRKHGEDFAAIQADLREWYGTLPRNHPSKKLSRYKWVDKWGPWRDRDISWPGGGGPTYDVPFKLIGPPCKVPEAGWRFSKWEEMERQIKRGLVEFREDHTQPPFRKAHLLPVPDEFDTTSEETDVEGEDDEDESLGLSVMPSVIQRQAQVAVKLLRKLFSGKDVFPNPKDHEVLGRLIGYVTKPGDLVLDSFAGSGTTGHAVLQLNKQDEASPRRFILVEMVNEIASVVTGERLKRVIAGVEGVEPLGSGFRFCRLGKTLFDEHGEINEDVPFTDLARYVYLIETGVPAPTRPRRDNPLLGVHEGRAVYLLYNGVLGDKRPSGGNVLTHAVLDALPPHPNGKSESRVVYGEACRLSEATLSRLNVTFRQTPYALREA
jgi:adenine-specific DNA-methyltransferase